MARLVVSRLLLVLGRDHHGLAFGAHEDLVLGLLEIIHVHQAFAAARGEQGGLVDQVGEVGAGHARGAARQNVGPHVGRDRHLAHVHQQDLLPPPDVGQAHHHLAVETAGAQQGGVEHVGAVGGGDHDDADTCLETVHFNQQLVERLFALVVAAAKAGAALTADRIDFVDEDDARRTLLGLLEHVAHARGADADEHLDEVGTRNAEERHLGLTRDRTREQRLAGTGRAHHQHAARNASAQLLEFGRVLQEIHQFGDIFLGLVAAGHVGKGHRVGILVEQACAALAERKRAARGRPPASGA